MEERTDPIAHGQSAVYHTIPRTVSPHVVRDYIQQQQRQHYHFADEEEEEMMEHELEGMGAMAIEADSAQPSGAPIPLPAAGSARGSPQEPHQDLLLQLEQREQQSPVLPRPADTRRVRHVAIDLRSPPSAGVGVHVAWGPAHVDGANAAEAEAAAAASSPSYLRATLAWERHHAQEKTAANQAHRGPSPPRRGSPPRSRHGGGLLQQPACRLAVGEEANSHGWGDNASAAPLLAASASRPYSPPGRRTAAAQQQEQKQRRAGVAPSLSPLRSWPLVAVAADATGSAEHKGRGGGDDGWPVLPAAAAAVVGGDGEEGWEEALEAKEEAELTFFEQLQVRMSTCPSIQPTRIVCCR